ncbi:MAG TPA: hypothetical protein VGK73_05860, partial [Polyangiaceae bacterium]
MREDTALRQDNATLSAANVALAEASSSKSSTILELSQAKGALMAEVSALKGTVAQVQQERDAL